MDECKSLVLGVLSGRGWGGRGGGGSGWGGELALHARRTMQTCVRIPMVGRCRLTLSNPRVERAYGFSA